MSGSAQFPTPMSPLRRATRRRSPRTVPRVGTGFPADDARRVPGTARLDGPAGARGETRGHWADLRPILEAFAHQRRRLDRHDRTLWRAFHRVVGRVSSMAAMAATRGQVLVSRCLGQQNGFRLTRLSTSAIAIHVPNARALGGASGSAIFRTMTPLASIIRRRGRSLAYLGRSPAH